MLRPLLLLLAAIGSAGQSDAYKKIQAEMAAENERMVTWFCDTDTKPGNANLSPCVFRAAQLTANDDDVWLTRSEEDRTAKEQEVMQTVKKRFSEAVIKDENYNMQDAWCTGEGPGNKKPLGSMCRQFKYHKRELAATKRMDEARKKAYKNKGEL